MIPASTAKPVMMLSVRGLANGVLALVLALALYVTATSPGAAEVLRQSIHSDILGRDYLFSVYVPPGWRSLTNLPVLYLLHGAGGDDTAWVSKGGVDKVAEELIQSRQVPPHIIIMPEMLDCWWVNSKTCRFEDFFWQEFDPAIARLFPVSARREDRMIGGISAGGFGAISFALSRPSSFVAAMALSPAIYTHQPPAFSQLRVHSPFLGPDRRLDDALWNQVNYPSRLAGYAAQDYRVAFYLSSGNQDPYGLTNEVITFYQAVMRIENQSVEVHISDGGHDWEYWRSIITQALIGSFAFRDAYLSAHADKQEATSLRKSPPVAGQIGWGRW